MKSILTEVSIAFTVTEPIEVSLWDQILFLVDTRKENVTRIIRKEDNIPEWVVTPKENILKFIYDFKIQYVECMYNQQKELLILYKIKYDNFEVIKNDYLIQLFSVLNINNPVIQDIRFKAYGELQINKPFNKVILADIITTNPSFNSIMALQEKVLTIRKNRLFSIAFNADLQPNYVRITLTVKDKIIVTISKLTDKKVVNVVMKTLSDLMDTYNNDYEELYKLYSYFLSEDDTIYCTNTEQYSAIKYLRDQVPELFINNYTRECPILPIILNENEAKLLKDKKCIIMYPQEGQYSRHYTAPDGFYVGLKKNRLKNSDIFPYIVTCYVSDHMIRKSSATYKYYINDNEKHRYRSNKPIPRSLIGTNSNYSRSRIQNDTFISALEVALNINIDINNLPWCPQLVKQELWDLSDDDIMKTIKSELNTGSCTFRYFEELLAVSIHVIPINNGKITSIIPRHQDQYIWKESYEKHIVIFENTKNIYGKMICTYDILLKNNNQTVFTSNESIIETILSQKYAQSILPIENGQAKYQLIDESGKCREIVTIDGEKISIYSRPLSVKELPKPECFIEVHCQKMNIAKEQMRVKTTDLTKQSTHNIRYFPNNESFQYWYRQWRLNCVNS